jgi:hypothetical protein
VYVIISLVCCAADDGSIAPLPERKSLPCRQDDDDSHDRKRMRCSWSDLPEVHQEMLITQTQISVAVKVKAG